MCTFLNSAQAGGVKVGNSGFVVLCKPSANFKYAGLYSLDYLLTEPASDEGAAPGFVSSVVKPRSVSTLEESLQRIRIILHRHTPSLLSSFDEFKQSVLNTTDKSKLHVWETTALKLINLDDQNFSVILPENCRSDGEKGIPAIIRQSPSFTGANNHFIYKYIPEIIEQLKEEAPLQLSFLIIHEWLWEVSSNPDRNRRINRFLHSEGIESMSNDDVLKELDAYGLTLQPLADPLFDIKSCTGTPLTQESILKLDKKVWSIDTNLKALGLSHVLSRDRLVSSDTTTINADDMCSLVWQPSTNPLLSQYDYGLFVQKNEHNDVTMNLLSPELLQGFGRPIISDSKQLECRFVNEIKSFGYNLECHFKDELLFTAITGMNSKDQIHDFNDVVVKGLITSECLRLEYIGFYEVNTTIQSSTNSGINADNSATANANSYFQKQTVIQILRDSLL